MTGVAFWNNLVTKELAVKAGVVASRLQSCLLYTFYTICAYSSLSAVIASLVQQV